MDMDLLYSVTDMNV